MTVNVHDYLDIKRRYAAGAGADDLCLSVAAWLARDLPPPDFLLGEVISTTSRVMLVAPTGLGKTNFVMHIAGSVAAGMPCLNWSTPRPARVLLIDGEMSRRLLKTRLKDLARRLGKIPDNLFALCRDDVDDMPPLNTQAGQEFIDSVIDRLGGVDLVVFDNVMSLITGDMKEEESWQQTLPWIKTLTKRSIGQMWVHHTGIDETRSYGTKTREWQLDTVALLERIERPDADIAFALSFTKSRERAPHNRADFEPVTITLENDVWHAEGSQPLRRGKSPSPKAQAFYAALTDAQASAGEIRPESAKRMSVTMNQWRAECRRLGLIDPNARDSQRSLFSKYRLELIGAGWAACNGEIAWSLRAVSVCA